MNAMICFTSVSVEYKIQIQLRELILLERVIDFYD